MRNFDKKEYYLDVDELISVCRITSDEKDEKDEKDEITPTTDINIFKYELLKMCVDRFLFEHETEHDEDPMLTYKQSNKSEAFDTVINTLIKYKILKTIYE